MPIKVKIASDFTAIHKEKIEIDYSMCNMNGELAYVSMLNLMQLISGNHAMKGGTSFFDMKAYNQAWVVTRMQVEIHQSPKWNEVIKAKTWIRIKSKTYSVRDIAFYSENKEKLFSASVLWVVINTQTRKPDNIVVPLDHYDLLITKATEGEPSKVRLPKEMQIIDHQTVKYSDLDMLKHANNSKYLHWVLDSLPITQLLNNRIQRMTLNFASELVYGDEIQIFRGRKSPTEEFYKIAKDDRLSCALQLHWQHSIT